MAISQFKAHCLEVVAELQATGKSLLITKRDKPVVEIHPIPLTVKEPLFGMLQDKAEIKADLIKPIGEKWDAEQE